MTGKSPHPRISQQTSAFSEDQYANIYPDGIEFHWWNSARTRIVEQAIRRATDKDTPVLEVGCGRGSVVSSLRKHGVDCHGVEIANIAPVSAAQGFVRFGMDAGSLPDSERERYGVILLLDVIEHIADPVDFMRQLSGAFARVSRFIVTVPARKELWSNYDVYNSHYRRYDLHMLRDLTDELGWSLEHSSYFFHSVYIPAWLLVKTKGSRPVEIRAPNGKLKKFVHGFVAQAMRADYLLVPSKLRGTSAIATFEVPTNNVL